MKKLFPLFFFVLCTSQLFSQIKKEDLVGAYVRFKNDTNKFKEKITIRVDGTYEYMEQQSYDFYYSFRDEWDLVSDTLKLITYQNSTNDFDMDTISFKQFIEQYKQKFLISKDKIYPLFNNGTPYIKQK